MKVLPYKIRLIELADLSAFRVLRRQALENHPAAFAKFPFEFDAISDQSLASMVCLDQNQFTFGIFLDSGDLVGMAGLFRGKHGKTAHKGTIWGVFVKPEFRGKGFAKELLTQVIAYAPTLKGVTLINLSVSQAQPAARALYLALGFKIFGKESRALKIEENYFAEEYMYLDL